MLILEMLEGVQKVEAGEKKKEEWKKMKLQKEEPVQWLCSSLQHYYPISQMLFSQLIFWNWCEEVVVDRME